MEAIEHVDYDAPGVVDMTVSEWTNLKSNISKLPQEKPVYKRKRAVFELKLLMRPEQKSCTWLKNSVCKSTKSENLVEDVCAGTFSDADACMLLPKRRRLIGCQVELNCLT